MLADDLVLDPDTEKQRPRIGDRFEVDRLLARGGMSAVYLARQVDVGRPVALKVLRPHDKAEGLDDFDERFRVEAKALASLNHPNIVTMFDFGQLPDGRCYLAMEYIEGPRLSDLLKVGPLEPARAVSLMLQVCRGISHAHRRGIIHRDLKPSNLLIRSEPDGSELVKVVDFGLVKLTDHDQSLTRDGNVMGSPHCMSPEQVRGLDIDVRTDVYAIGVLLFRALTGRYPFHGPTPAATMMAHVSAPTPTFFSVAPEVQVPAGLEPIVRRCLEKDPSRRYPDVEALMADLRLAADPGLESSRTDIFSSTLVRPDADQRAERSLLFAAIGLGVAGLTLAGLWLALQPGEAPSPPQDPPVAAVSMPAHEPVVAPAPTTPPAPSADAAAGAMATQAASPATPTTESTGSALAGSPAPPALGTPRPAARPAARPPAPRPAKAAAPPTAAPEVPPPRPPPPATPPAGYKGVPDDL